jgi:hypothetical protein
MQPPHSNTHTHTPGPLPWPPRKAAVRSTFHWLVSTPQSSSDHATHTTTKRASEQPTSSSCPDCVSPSLFCLRAGWLLLGCGLRFDWIDECRGVCAVVVVLCVPPGGGMEEAPTR